MLSGPTVGSVEEEEEEEEAGLPSPNECDIM